jgi:hypothetical protein
MQSCAAPAGGLKRARPVRNLFVRYANGKGKNG